MQREMMAHIADRKRGSARQSAVSRMGFFFPAVQARLPSHQTFLPGQQAVTQADQQCNQSGAQESHD
jgi:hypothetical protein